MSHLEWRRNTPTASQCGLKIWSCSALYESSSQRKRSPFRGTSHAVQDLQPGMSSARGWAVSVKSRLLLCFTAKGIQGSPTRFVERKAIPQKGERAWSTGSLATATHSPGPANAQGRSAQASGLSISASGWRMNGPQSRQMRPTFNLPRLSKQPGRLK